MRISAVIPLLNEEHTLRELHARLGAALKQIAPDDHEIIFVDDGSVDGSMAVLAEIAADDPQVTVIELRRNFGKAAALAAGFAEARGECLVTLDADLQDVPEEVPRLIERLEAGADLVTGRKRLRRDPWTRVFASWIFNRVVSLLTGSPVHDVNSGLKAMRRDVIRDVPLYGELHRYLPVLARSRGYRIEEIEVTHQPRRFGSSRYGWSRYVSGLFDTFTVLMLTRYDKRPLHFFGIFGAALTLTGLAILAYLSVGWLFGQYIGNRPLFTLAVLMVILGLQSGFFGLLAELVVLGDRREPTHTIRRTLGKGGSGDTASR
jgi:glycosyltransferase involved in cell wall biosynthesis